MRVIYQIPDRDPITFETGPKAVSHCDKLKHTYQGLIGIDTFWYITERVIIESNAESKLYDIYKKCERYLELQRLSKTTDLTEFLNLINELLDVISYEDVLSLCIELDLPIYNIFSKEFDVSIVNDQRGTRVQTYVRDDYIELVALISYLRILFPLIYGFIMVNRNELGKKHIDYKIVTLLLNTKLIEIPAFVKIKELIALTVRTELNKRTVKDIQNLIKSKFIDDEEIPIYSFGIVLIQVILIHNFFRDVKDATVVSIYVPKCKTALNTTTTSNKLLDKSTGKDSTDDNDHSGMLEEYRITTDIMISSKVLINEIYGDLNNYRKYNLNMDTYYKVYDDLASLFQEDNALRETLTKTQLELITAIGKLVYDPRSSKIIRADKLRCLLSAVFTWLWHNGYQPLALFLTSVKRVTDDMDIGGNIRLSSDKYEQETLNRALEIYKGFTEKQIKENIDIYIRHMYSERWVIISTSFTEETYWNVPKMRNLLLKVFIDLYELDK